jgi:hypothetical protein
VIVITGGSTGQVLTLQANGTYAPATASGGSPGGSSGQVQYNNASALDGSIIWINSNAVDVRNSTNVMSFNLFRTYTSSTNFETFRVLNVASTGTRIGNAIGSAGGTGGASRQLDFGRWNAAGTWTSLLGWDSNDFLNVTTQLQVTGVGLMVRCQNTQIGSVDDGAGLVVASNGYQSAPNATAFTTRTGQGANNVRHACIFSTFHGVTAATSYFDWRQADPASNSTSSIMRLLFDGSLTVTAKLTGVAGTTARSPMCFPDGVAPTSPVNGDIWFVGDVMYRRIGGVTKSLTFT